MRKLKSMTELRDYFSDTARLSKQYGRFVASYVSIFTMLMKTCKGRDKICSFIQYSSDFYYHCLKYSQIEQIQKAFKLNELQGALIALKLRNSMKNSRKIFKFLKFIDQIASIVKKIQSNKPLYMKIVGIMENLMACISNFFDNIIWGINIEVLNYWFADKYKYFKANKYFFSLCKLIFKMLGNNFQHHHRIKNMKGIVLKLRYFKDEMITSSNETFELAKQYLNQRREVRMQALDGAISICRIIMLVRKLKLPGYTFVTKILYSFMGLVSTFLSVLKMIYEQPTLIQLKQRKERIVKKNKQVNGQNFEKPKRLRVNRSGIINLN